MQCSDEEGELVQLEVAKPTMPIADCITEYQLNEQRMGIFEVILNNINTLNAMNSNQLDQQEEKTNSYLTFENVDVSQVLEHIDEFRSKRILAVKTANPETPAKIGSVVLQNDDGTINDKYRHIEQRMFDIVGVPMATSNTGQGVSGEAQVYGGGWENAQIMALVDTQYTVQFERQDLKKFIDICKDVAGTKIPNLVSSEIDIKYTINKSNNMQVKAQSMTYFVEHGFTREQALEFCEITDDPQTQGAIADKNVEDTKNKDLDFEINKIKKMAEANPQPQNEGGEDKPKPNVPPKKEEK